MAPCSWVAGTESSCSGIWGSAWMKSRAAEPLCHGGLSNLQRKLHLHHRLLHAVLLSDSLRFLEPEGCSLTLRQSQVLGIDPGIAVLDAFDQRPRIELAKARRKFEQTRRLRFDLNVLQRNRRTISRQQLYREFKIGIDPALTRTPR